MPTKSYTVYLFSDSGKTLFKKDFSARDDRDADNKAVKLVRPHLDKHDDVDDWVVEEKVGKKAKIDPKEELAIRALLAEDKLQHDGKAKMAKSAFDLTRALENMAVRRPDLVASGDIPMPKDAKGLEALEAFVMEADILKPKQAGDIFEDFGFGPQDEPPTPIDTQLRWDLEKKLGEQAQMLSSAPMFSGNVRNLIGDRVYYFGRKRAWFVYIDAPASQAVAKAKRAQKMARGSRSVKADQIILRGRTLFVGSNDGKLTEVKPIYKAGKTAKTNAKIVEVPNTFHPVKVEPPKKVRKEFPFEGYIDFQGLQIDVENVKGSTRSGTGPEGDWSTFMHAHYGEIRGTEGTDGDMLDVYVGDNHDSSIVVVVHQYNPWDGKYDEDKVVIGCESVEEAIGLYKKQYDRPGFYREGEHTAMPIGAFWRWVHEVKNKGKRVSASRKASAAADAVIADLVGVMSKWPGHTVNADGSPFVDRHMMSVLIRHDGEDHTVGADKLSDVFIDAVKATRTAASVLRITASEVTKRLKAERWRNDRHDQSYDIRTASFYSIFITQRRHNGTKQEHFLVVWYTGNPSHRWDSKTVDTLKDAVVLANKVKPESDRISAEELGESPIGKLAADKWVSVPRLDLNTIKDAVWVKWVRITSSGQMGEVVARRMPNGWNAQLLRSGQKYDPKDVRGRPRKDADLIKLFTDGGGSAPYIVKGEAAAPAPAATITTGQVTSFLKNMSTKIGGRNRDVDYYPPGKNGFRSPFWSAEPANRQRLDHYVGSFYNPGPDDDPEGWDEEGWSEDYAGPLHTEVQKKLDAQFGKGMFNVDIGEKGHIDVQATKLGLAALGMAKQGAVMWKKGYAEGRPGALNAAKVVYSNLLAMLRAVQWNHLTSHWQIGGDSSYGDHLLFERLYTKAVEETDALAEKLVGTFGIAAVDALEQAKLMAFTLVQWADIGCPFERGLHVENTLRVNIEQCLKAMEDIGQLSIGMDDFLRTMVNDHETHTYLLQQRQGGVKMASATAGAKRKARQQQRAFTAKCLLRQFAREVVTAGGTSAVRGIFDGTPSDGQPWRGGPVKFGFDFGSPQLEILSQNEVGGVTTWSVKFTFAKTPRNYGSGAYAESILIARHLKAFPGDERAMLAEFMRRMRGEQGKMAGGIAKWFKEQWYKPFGDIVGFRETRDWEDGKLVKFGSVSFGKNPTLSRDRIWLPAVVTATFSARKLPDMKVGPFTQMSDRELDGWISTWEDYAPENFWMDGELQMNHSQAMAYYRKKWRAMRPREQHDMLEGLKHPAGGRWATTVEGLADSVLKSLG